MLSDIRAQGSFEVLKTALLVLALALAVLGIIILVTRNSEEAATSCTGVCANGVYPITDEKGVVIGHEDIRTCEGLNVKEGRKVYIKSIGECSPGYECCGKLDIFSTES